MTESQHEIKPVDQAEKSSESTESLSESDAQRSASGSKFSRRDFLKAVTGVMAGGVSATLPSVNFDLPAVSPTPIPDRTSTPESRETLTPDKRVVFVDMVPEYDNTAVTRQLLGELYVPLEGLNSISPGSGARIVELIRNGEDNEVATVLAHEYLKTIQDHGEFTTGTYIHELTELGHDVGTPRILPLQAVVSGFEYNRDGLGNPSITVEVDEQKIGDLLEEHFNNHPEVQVVNLSLLIGKGRHTQVLKRVAPLPTNQLGIYDNRDRPLVTVAEDIQTWTNAPDGRFLPHRLVNGELVPLEDDELLTPEQYDQLNRQHELDVIAAYQAGQQSDLIEEVWDQVKTENYNPEFARENLTRLVRLCRRFPDKSFNVAGGNENSFFYHIRQEMERNGEWADNLRIMAGETDRSDGADIYASKQFSRLSRVPSSQVTAIVSALDSILANQGYSLEDRMSIVESYCQPFQVQLGDDQSRQALNLIPRLYQSALSVNPE